MKRYRSIDDEGVSNVVATIMLLAMFMSVLSMVMTTYLPAWAESNEATHMLNAADSFLELKTNIDTQILRGDIDTTMTTGLPLGSHGGPIFGVGRSTGGISIEPWGCHNSIRTPTDLLLRGKGALNYTATNYYMENQDYFYEHGGVILQQSGSSVMKFTPNINFRREGTEIYFSCTLASLQTSAALRESGSSTVAIYTTLLSNEKLIYTDATNLNLTLNTAFPELWSEFFTSEATSGGLLVADYDIDYDVTNQWVSIQFPFVDYISTKQAVVEVEFQR